jgi:predicted dehydrogenase
MKSALIIGCGKPQQIGPGHKVGWAIAYAHAQGYLDAFPGVDLYAVDPNRENLEAFASKHRLPASRCFVSADDALAAHVPDAASVCTWPALHAPLAMQAARAGVKAVTIEKPLALDGFQIAELMSAAAQGKTRFAVAHQRRYEPPFVKAKQVIRSGRLGEKLVVEGRVGDDWDMLSWTVHWFDMANYIFDHPPLSVMAGIDHTGERRYGHAVENASIVFADYGEGRQAIFITGPATSPFFGITVRGERGMMQVGHDIRLWTDAGSEVVPCDSPQQDGPFASLFKDLWRSTIESTPSLCDITRTADATLMAYAAHESATTARAVKLPLRTWYAPLEVRQHAPQPDPSPTFQVAVLADPHHEWTAVGYANSGRDGLVDALKSLGHSVRLIDARHPLADDSLAGCDLLVLYHTQQKTCETHRRVVGEWLERGRAVVVSHCGIGAYADWPAYRAAIGRYWVWGGEDRPPSGHPHLSCRLDVIDESFGTGWRQSWLPIDEVYVQLGESSAVRPLVRAVTETGIEQDYAWQVVDQPNVVVWLPGHRADMFELAAVREGLAASVRLAAVNARAWK